MQKGAIMSKKHAQHAKNMRKIWIRPFLAEVFGISTRSVSYKFGIAGRIQPKKVRDFLLEHGFLFEKKTKKNPRK